MNSSPPDISTGSAGDEDDVFVTESDYEEAFDSELANEEILLTQGPAYYFAVNSAEVPEPVRPSPPTPPLGPPPSYGSNTIKTANYTWWNFIPLNLAVQFRHYYNIYFLIAAILSLIPSISPLNPLATVLPLLIVICLTFIKDGYADYKRHRVDHTVNDKIFVVCHEGQWQSKRSAEIQVGDLVLLARNEKLPADCVLLRVSRDDDLKNEGGCFIETSDLDGESNMKRKEIPPLLRDYLYRKRKLTMPEYGGSVDDEKALMGDFDGLVECEVPNDSIHSFLGLLKVVNLKGKVQRSPPVSPLLDDDDYAKKKAQYAHKRDISSPSTLQESLFKEVLTIPLGYQHFLPRGASLKSTEFVIVVVVYVGKNTKVFKNLKKRKRGKDSTLTTALNKLMLAVFFVNFIVLALATLFGGLYLKNYGQYSEYLFPPPNSDSIQTVALQQLAAYYILFQYFVPLSLFISVEIARVFLALYIQADDYLAPADCSHRSGEPKDATARRSKLSLRRFSRAHKNVFLHADGHCQVRNFNLHEDLAKVKYIFSDKTGTLTKNIMKLHQWGICQDNQDLFFLSEELEPGILKKTLSECSGGGPRMFFARLVSLCHAVIPTMITDSETGLETLVYEGQSPDEVALVEAMANNGLRLLKRSKRKIVLENYIMGTVVHEDYTVLYTIDFTSERKKMSIVVRFKDHETEHHKIYLLTKGADSVMLPRINFSADGFQRFQRQIDALSTQGLRVLVLGARELSDDTFHRFKMAIESAEKEINQREKRLAQAYSLIERDYMPIGCVAVEDKLQDQVPETLKFLLDAEIRIWLLTGDKLETAVNIGMSSQLILPDMQIVTFSTCNTINDYYSCISSLARHLYGDVIVSSDEPVLTREDLHDAELQLQREILNVAEQKKVALVVDGQLIDATMQYSCALFIQLTLKCASVIVCRASPLQKSLVISLVKSQTEDVTLAIGDGANDVSMIETADIGVGIAGREGGQASKAADYAIAEFRFLKRLLVVHGRYAYLRLSKLILVSIYKNFMLAMTMFWFGIYSAWSAQTLYNSLFLFLYNVVYTSLSPMVIALFEKDVSERQLLKYPKLYTPLARGFYFTWRQIFKTFFWAFAHSIIIFFVLYGLFEGTDVSNTNGRVGGLALLQTFVSTMVFLTVNIRILMVHRHRNIFTVLVYAISILLFLGNLFLFELGSFIGKDAGIIAMQLPSYFLGNIFVVLACLFPEYAIKYFRKQYYPSDADIIHEHDVLSRRTRKSDE